MTAPGSQPALRERRDALAEQVAQLQFHLGGLTYEMAIRDHFRLDVLVRRAAALQELDAQLGEIERLLAPEESASTGTCAACGAIRDGSSHEVHDSITGTEAAAGNIRADGSGGR